LSPSKTLKFTCDNRLLLKTLEISLFRIHKCLKLKIEISLLWLVGMQRRLRAILLFPVLALLFAVGWVLYVVGGKKTDYTAAPKRKPRDSNQVVADVDAVEMGLIEEIVEPLDD
jgi:hypothetical protein